MSWEGSQFAEEGDVFMGGSVKLFFKLSKRQGSDLTGWPLMSHEYKGTTCLQSNAVNMERNTPPGISIHTSWLYFRGAKGSPPPLLDWFQWPFRTPLSSEENTFFMSTHKLCLGPFRGAQSLSRVAMWPISHRFPRTSNRLCVCLNPFISPHVRRHL